MNTFSKKNKKHFRIFVFLLVIMTFPNVVYAEDPKLVTGTLALFNAAMNWLLILIPTGAALKLAYHAFKKMINEDQAIITEQNRMMKNSLITAVIAETAVSVVKIVLSFYQ